MHCSTCENQTYKGTWFFGVESWKSLKDQENLLLKNLQLKTRVENVRFLSWRTFFVGKYGIQSTDEMAFKRTETLREFSISRHQIWCAHAIVVQRMHACARKIPPVLGKVNTPKSVRKSFRFNLIGGSNQAWKSVNSTCAKVWSEFLKIANQIAV